MEPRPGWFMPKSHCCRPGNPPHRRTTPPADLPPEIVEEILLCLPPWNPEALVRASTVCKDWGRIISAPGFLRRYRQRHGYEDLVGFVSNLQNGYSEAIVRFEATSPSRPHRVELSGWRALDARHGRVLLCGEAILSVWDPTTGDRWEVSSLPGLHPQCLYNAAFMCSEENCVHSNCAGDAFNIVLLCVDPSEMLAIVYIYTSLTSQWMRVDTPWMLVVVDTPPALVKNCIYFCLDLAVLGYDLESSNAIRIYLPKGPVSGRSSIYATRQQKLGFASLSESKISTWELKAAEEEVWEPIFSIDVNSMMLFSEYSSCTVVLGLVLVGAEDGIYEVHGGIVRKRTHSMDLRSFIPYVVPTEDGRISIL